MADDDTERILAASHVGAWPLVIVLPFISLFFFAPLVWAIVTCALITIAFGLVTAKKIVGVWNNWTALAVSPFLGGIWVGFFYMLFTVIG